MDDVEISGEIFNVGSANRISILDLAERVIEMTESDSSRVFVPYERVYGAGIEDMLHRIPSIDKIRATIGWKPALDLERILDDVIEHTRARMAVEGKEAAAAAR
jgi:UDP-glucose 4-epimerase